jgi:cell division protein FtsB
MRQHRKELDLFNFSFVDILATTIGALVFIMVLVLLNTAKRVQPQDWEDMAKQRRAEAQQLQAEAHAWQAQRENLLRLDEEHRPGQPNAREGAVIDLRELRDKAEKLEQNNQHLRESEQALKQEVDRLRTDIRAGEATTARARKRTEVPFRVPEERPTTKKNFVVECDGGRIYCLAFEGELVSRNYTAIGLPGCIFIKRSAGARGETDDELKQRGSAFRQKLARTGTATHYLAFLVREDSFATFRELRGTLWRAGYDVSWVLLRKDEQIVVGSGGGATVL